MFLNVTERSSVRLHATNADEIVGHIKDNIDSRILFANDVNQKSKPPHPFAMASLGVPAPINLRMSKLMLCPATWSR